MGSGGCGEARSCFGASIPPQVGAKREEQKVTVGFVALLVPSAEHPVSSSVC